MYRKKTLSACVWHGLLSKQIVSRSFFFKIIFKNIIYIYIFYNKLLNTIEHIN